VRLPLIRNYSVWWVKQIRQTSSYARLHYSFLMKLQASCCVLSYCYLSVSLCLSWMGCNNCHRQDVGSRTMTLLLQSNRSYIAKPNTWRGCWCGRASGRASANRQTLFQLLDGQLSLCRGAPDGMSWGAGALLWATSCAHIFLHQASASEKVFSAVEMQS